MMDRSRTKKPPPTDLEDILEESYSESLYDRVKVKMDKSRMSTTAALEISSLRPEFESTRLSFVLPPDDKTASPTGKKRGRPRKSKMMTTLAEIEEDSRQSKQSRMQQEIEALLGSPKKQVNRENHPSPSSVKKRSRQEPQQIRSSPRLGRYSNNSKIGNRPDEVPPSPSAPVGHRGQIMNQASPMRQGTGAPRSRNSRTNAEEDFSDPPGPGSPQSRGPVSRTASPRQQTPTRQSRNKGSNSQTGSSTLSSGPGESRQTVNQGSHARRQVRSRNQTLDSGESEQMPVQSSSTIQGPTRKESADDSASSRSYRNSSVGGRRGEQGHEDDSQTEIPTDSSAMSRSRKARNNLSTGEGASSVRLSRSRNLGESERNEKRPAREIDPSSVDPLVGASPKKRRTRGIDVEKHPGAVGPDSPGKVYRRGLGLSFTALKSHGVHQGQEGHKGRKEMELSWTRTPEKVQNAETVLVPNTCPPEDIEEPSQESDVPSQVPETQITSRGGGLEDLDAPEMSPNMSKRRSNRSHVGLKRNDDGEISSSRKNDKSQLSVVEPELVSEDEGENGEQRGAVESKVVSESGSEPAQRGRRLGARGRSLDESTNGQLRLRKGESTDVTERLAEDSESENQSRRLSRPRDQRAEEVEGTRDGSLKMKEKSRKGNTTADDETTERVRDVGSPAQRSLPRADESQGGLKEKSRKGNTVAGDETTERVGDVSSPAQRSLPRADEGQGGLKEKSRKGNTMADDETTERVRDVGSPAQRRLPRADEGQGAGDRTVRDRSQMKLSAVIEEEDEEEAEEEDQEVWEDGANEGNGVRGEETEEVRKDSKKKMEEKKLKRKKSVPVSHVDVSEHMKNHDLIQQLITIRAAPITPRDPLVLAVYKKATASNSFSEDPIPKDVVQKVFEKANKRVYDEVHGYFNPKVVQEMLSELDSVQTTQDHVGVDIDRCEKQLVALNVERVLETLPEQWPSSSKNGSLVERYNSKRSHITKLLAKIKKAREDLTQYKSTMELINEVKTLSASLDMESLVTEVQRSQKLAATYNKLKRSEANESKRSNMDKSN